jgi:hypothetical protein
MKELHDGVDRSEIPVRLIMQKQIMVSLYVFISCLQNTSIYNSVA